MLYMLCILVYLSIFLKEAAQRNTYIYSPNKALIAFGGQDFPSPLGSESRISSYSVIYSSPKVCPENALKLLFGVFKNCLKTTLKQLVFFSRMVGVYRRNSNKIARTLIHKS